MIKGVVEVISFNHLMPVRMLRYIFVYPSTVEYEMHKISSIQFITTIVQFAQLFCKKITRRTSTNETFKLGFIFRRLTASRFRLMMHNGSVLLLVFNEKQLP